MTDIRARERDNAQEYYTDLLLTKSYIHSSAHHREFTKEIKQDYKNNQEHKTLLTPQMKNNKIDNRETYFTSQQWSTIQM